MIIEDAKKLIIQSDSRGVWIGYLRKEIGADAVNDLLESGEFVKVKQSNPIHNNGSSGMVWAVKGAKK
jgi:hypothetical protein